MKAISFASVKDHLGQTMSAVCRDRLPVVITRGKSDAVVMMSLADYRSMEETAYLLRSPTNARRLRRSMRGLNQGKGIAVDLKSLA